MEKQNVSDGVKKKNMHFLNILATYWNCHNYHLFKNVKMQLLNIKFKKRDNRNK